MEEILVLTCIVGSIIQYWRALASDGFGLGPLNSPMLLWSPLSNFAVFAAGFTLKWGSVAILTIAYGWEASLCALILGFLGSRLVVRNLCRRDIEVAQNILAAERAGGTLTSGESKVILCARCGKSVLVRVDEVGRKVCSHCGRPMEG